MKTLNKTFEQKKKEEFEEKFHKYNSDDWDDDLWSFISNALSDYKKELMDEAQKLKKEINDDYICPNCHKVGETCGCYDFNLGVEAVLSLLQKDKEDSK